MKLEILTPATGGFILGRARFGVDRLGSEGDPEEWVDVLDRATTVTFSRGGTTSELNAPDSGRLSATFKGVDPDVELWLTPGREVRVVDDQRVGEPVLWAGVVEDALVTGGGEYDLTTLVAVDTVGELAAATVRGTGQLTYAGHTLRERAGQVLGATSARLRFIGTDTPRHLRGNVHEGPATEHLTMAANSFAGAAWRVALDGVVEVVTGLDDATTPPAATFSDKGDTPHTSYKALALSYATADVVNTLDVTNRGRNADGTADDDTTTHIDVTSAATYRRRKGEAVLNLLPQLVSARAAQIIAETAAVRLTPSGLTYRYRELAVGLDLLDKVTVERRGRRWPAVVVGQAHTIQPEQGVHDVTLTLKAGRPLPGFYPGAATNPSADLYPTED